MAKRRKDDWLVIESIGDGIPFPEALKKGKLNEAIQLAWYALRDEPTCGREVRFLAQILAAYEDEKGLELLRQRAEERSRKDARYQPAFRKGFGEEGNVSLLELIDKGSSEAELLREIRAFVASHPSVTRAELYQRFNVFNASAISRL